MSRRLPPFLSRLFHRFHGRPAGRPQVGGFYDPKSLIYLGRAVAIVYESDKFHGGGDGKTADYMHEFETPAALFMDERAGKQLYILGPQIKVTRHGIEN